MVRGQREFLRWGVLRRLRALALTVTALAVATSVLTCTSPPDGNGAATERTVPSSLDQLPKPEVLADTVGGFFNAYNRGDMASASRFFARGLIQKCGGQPRWEGAYSRLRSVEKLDYSLDALSLNSAIAGLSADIVFTSHNKTGVVIDDRSQATVRFGFDPQTAAWVMTDDWRRADLFC